MSVSTARRRLSSTVELDTEAVGPDSLKAAFDVAIDALLSRSARNGQAVDWETAEMALTHCAGETLVVVRAGIL